MKKYFIFILIIFFTSCSAISKNQKNNSYLNYKKGEYYGQVADNVPHGIGKIFFPNGDKYDGSWENGEINGYGIYEYVNGDVYDGNFVNGKKEGKGKMNYKNGNYYDGLWKDDEWFSKGSYKSSTYLYQGTIKKNSVTGYGKMFFYEGSLSGDKYEGNVEYGSMSGKGVYYQKDGIIIIGTWVKNKKQGNMVVLWQNGDRLECEFKNDMANGYGYLYDKNGKLLKKGLFVNNVLIQNEAK